MQELAKPENLSRENALTVEILCLALVRERPDRTGPWELVGGVPHQRPWCPCICLTDRQQEMYGARLGADLPGGHPRHPLRKMSVSPLRGCFRKHAPPHSGAS